MRKQGGIKRSGGQYHIPEGINGALTEDVYDRQKCYELLLENADIYEEEGLADVCGKCTSVVPCSFMNPVAKVASKKLT